MKKIILLFISFYCLTIYSQSPTITINLPPNPPSDTAQWGTGSNIFNIFVAGANMGMLMESNVLVTIKSNGSVKCGSYTPETAQSSNIVNATPKSWIGSSAAALLGQDCILPPGNYEVCVQFYGYKSGSRNALLLEKCVPFIIHEKIQENFSPPQNILPADGKKMTETEAKSIIKFLWTPVVPKPKELVTYKLRVWQLMQGQTGTQAMQVNQPIIEKEIDNITQAIIANLLQDPCKPPYLCNYVWNVQAANKQGIPIGGNDGMSEATNFGVNSSPTITPPNNPGNTVVVCNTISQKTFHTNDIIHLSDGFNLKLTEEPTGINDSLSGKGTVDVKWIGVLNVQFKKIKINGSDNLCSGAVYTVKDTTQAYPTQWAVNVLNNNSFGVWNINKIKAICDGIKSNKLTKPLIPATNQISTLLAVNSLNMPLGYFKNQDENNILGFTEMVFKPDTAEFEMIVSLNTEKFFSNENNTFNGTNAIALQGTGIKFTNSGLKGINGTIKLLQPITFTYTHANTEPLKITFNTEEPNLHIGNSIIFSNSVAEPEFWKYNLDINAQLPKEWLIPVDTTKTNVDMNFQSSIVNWSDYILQGSLPACTIPNTNGLGIEVGNIVYDHSLIENSAAITFPDEYTGDTTELFSGFYLKNFNITLPDQLRSYEDPLKPIKIGSDNLIIDKEGITGKIFAHNVLTFPKANIGNLGASIDTVSVKLNKSILTEAKMLGKITLPMSSTDLVANAISYKALFLPSGAATANTSSFTFTLLPDNDIESKFFGDGKLKIDATSSLNLLVEKTAGSERKINFNIDVNGKVYYPLGKIKIPITNKFLDIDLSCNFENLKMGYTKNGTSDGFTFSPGHWAFASPQKKLCGFSFTIIDVKPKIEPIIQTSEANYLLKGGVEFTAKINVGTEKLAITADAKIILEGAVVSTEYGTTTLNSISAVKSDYKFLTHLKPKFLDVKVENINIDAKVAGAEIKGSVELKKDDPVFGNAFIGDLTAKFNSLKVAVQAGAVFGNTKYRPGNTGLGFKYWMVQAQINLPPPGIPFMTGLAVRGFGAGVYSHMDMTPPAVFNPTAAASSTFGGAVFTPNKTVDFGFKAKLIIATTPKEETFNGSVALAAEFNTNGGMNFIDFQGLFNCGAKIGNESKAFANGNIVVHYDFVNKIFDLNTALIINKDPISTDPAGINTKLHIDSKNNKWFFKSGTATSPNKVYVIGASINTYLMFGNDIEIPNSFMQETKNGFASIGYGLPNFSDNATGEGSYKNAKGFAFGLGINYKKSDGWNVTSFHGSICDCDRFLNINYNIVAGGEVDASLLQYSGCQGFGDGWRAKLSMAMYAGANIGYSYNLPGFGTDTHNGPLASVSSSFYGTAEFPNPTFFEGDLNGDFSLCSYSIGFHKHFINGSQCAGTATVTNDPTVYIQENVANDLSYNLIKNIITPSSKTNVSRVTNFEVVLNYPFNEPFDVQEQQASGQINVRTFRAIYSVSLKKDSISSGPISIQPSNMNGSVGQTNMNNATTKVQANTLKLPGKIKTGSVNTNGTNQTAIKQTNLSALNPNILSDIELIAGGIDPMGAKNFRIKALANSGPNQIALNALQPGTSYKFEIIGVLQEQISGNWLAVNKKNTTVSIKQTKYIYFKTNADAVGALANTSSSANQTQLNKK